MRDGLIGAMTVAENLILDTYHREPYSRRGSLNAGAIAEGAATAVKDYDVRTPSIDTLAGSLSGGNQQKVVVAREFSRPVKLVIASQPTRGLDVGSIEYIHRRLVEQRDAGAAVLIVSTELDEVLAVGDRVAVMLGGRIVAIVEGPAATRENVGMLMGGAE
jgi:simple sugar transport system ATP-binding protein